MTSTGISTQRLRLLEVGQSLLGAPYVWAAKGTLHPNENGLMVPCYDCSGFVTHCYLQVGGFDWRPMHNCQRLFIALPQTKKPFAGDLCFYGTDSNRVSHVMMWVGDGRVIGACGGDSRVTSVEIARQFRAMVKFKNSHLYRKDFLGFGSSPFPHFQPLEST